MGYNLVETRPSISVSSVHPGKVTGYLKAGYAVYLKPGRYTIDSPIYLYNRAKLLGIGEVTISPSRNFSGSSLVTTYANNYSDLFVHNLSFDLQGSNSLNALTINRANNFKVSNIKTSNGSLGDSGAGLDIDGCSDFYLAQIEAIGMPTHGIALKNCSRLELQNFILKSCGHRGLLIDPDCNNVKASYGWCIGNRFNGVHISHGSKNVNLFEITANDNGIHGFAVQSADSQRETSGSYVILDRCHAHRNTQNGLYNHYGSYVIVTHSDFVGNLENGIRSKEALEFTASYNVCSGNGFRGLTVEGGDTVTAQYNEFTFNDREGVYLSGSISGLTLSDNNLTSNSTGEIKNDTNLDVDTFGIH